MTNHKDNKISSQNPNKPFYETVDEAAHSLEDKTINADIPTTEDGIPLEVNGQKLNEVQLQALREAQQRRLVETQKAREIGGAKRDTDPTRYGDWEKSGRAIDFS